jgi:rod shape-determining protein MreC
MGLHTSVIKMCINEKRDTLLRQKGMKKKYILICVFVWTIIWLLCATLRQYTACVCSYVVYPALAAQKLVMNIIKDVRCTKAMIRDLQEKLETLQTTYDALCAEHTQCMALLSYVDATKELSAFKRSFDCSDDCIAQILVKHITDCEHYVLINVGSSSYITQDMIAIVNDTILGRVVTVYPWYSKVQLITDPKVCIPVYASHSNMHGIHVGTGSINRTVVGRINHFESVKVGENVITSGEGLIFPRGYRLGKIVSVRTVGLYHEAQVEPAIDVSTIDYCLVHMRTQ